MHCEDVNGGTCGGGANDGGSGKRATEGRNPITISRAQKTGDQRGQKRGSELRSESAKKKRGMVFPKLASKLT